MSSKSQPVFSVKPEEGLFTIYRDETALQTPRNLSVTVATQKLADAIIEESNGQGERLDLRKMPFTQMTLTAIDISSMHRSEVVDGILKYGETELLCHRASEPPELVAEQNKVWQPYIDWMQQKFGIQLRVGAGILPIKQDEVALASLREVVESVGAFSLTGLSEAVGLTGSIVLGLALSTGYATPDMILKVAELEHLWQSQKWGEDPATEARHNAIKGELEMCARWFSLIA